MNNKEHIDPVINFDHQTNFFGARDVAFWLIRRVWLIFLLLTIFFLAGLYVYNISPKIYEAVSTVEIERGERATTLDEKNNYEVMLGGKAMMQTAVDKLLLPKHFKLLVETLELDERDDIIREKLRLFKAFDYFENEEDDTLAKMDEEKVANMIMAEKWLKPSIRRDSYLVDVKVQHSSPEVAQLIANGILDAYQTNVDSSIQSNTTKNVKIARELVDQAEEEILGIGERLSLYNSCLSTKERIATADQEVLELKKRYGPKWPALIEAEAKLKTITDLFEVELNQVKKLSPIEKEYWDQLPEGIDQIQNVDIRASFIAAEVKNKEQLRDSLINKIDEAVVHAKASREFSVQKRADLPTEPIAPSMLRILFSFTIAGMGFSFMLVIILGILDPSLRTVGDLEKAFNIPVLGALPKCDIKSDELIETKDRLIAPISSSTRQLDESFRNLRAGLIMLGSQKDRKTFLITSAIPGEGKSFTSAHIAKSFAAQGDLTLIIDMDLRKPVQHQIFGTDRINGVTDILVNELDPASLIQETQIENLHFLSVGTKAPNPSELITEISIKQIFDALSSKYQRIVIDTAPVLPVRDCLPLAKIVDSVILVYKMGSTHKKAVGRVLNIFKDNGSLPVGIVANSLPPINKSFGYYGYYGSYHYGSYYYSYYGNGSYYGEEELDS